MCLSARKSNVKKKNGSAEGWQTFFVWHDMESSECMAVFWRRSFHHGPACTHRPCHQLVRKTFRKPKPFPPTASASCTPTPCTRHLMRVNTERVCAREAACICEHLCVCSYVSWWLNRSLTTFTGQREPIADKQNALSLICMLNVCRCRRVGVWSIGCCCWWETWAALGQVLSALHRVAFFCICS